MTSYAGRRRQQVAVVAAVLLVVLALTSWPDTPREAAAAATACGPSDLNRATLTTANGVTMRPCLAKVTLRVDIPRTQTSNAGCGFLFLQKCYADGKWRITSVKRSDLQTVKYADGTLESLYRLTFSQFQIIRDATFTTAGGPSTLTLAPAGPASLGGTSSGSVIYTDMWVTGASMIYLNFLTFNCIDGVQVDNPLLALSNVIDITDTGCGMNLEIRYLVTTSAAANGAVSGVYSVNLPNTRVSVS